jgi:SAM-dependent methyltransferase
MKQPTPIHGARIAEDKQRVEYQSYEDYVAHQATRKNIFDPDAPPRFDPASHPHIVEDLGLLYYFISPDDQILDVGCRSGWSCLRMQHDGYQNVLGVELQMDNVLYGQAMGAPIQQGDAHELTFEDEQFDVAFTRHSWEHLLDPHKATREVYRVLKPGGLVFMVVPFQPQGLDNLTYAHSYIYDTPERFLALFDDFQKVLFRQQPKELTYVGVKADTVPPHLQQAARRARWYIWRADAQHFATRVKKALQKRLGF